MLFGKSSAAVFVLQYDNNTRVGVYAYDKEHDKIETILPAYYVEVGPHVEDDKYYLFVDNDGIKISCAAASMTFYCYIIRHE